MAVVPKQLVPSTLLLSAPSSVYTAANCRTLCDKVTLHNSDATNRNVYVAIVAVGGTPSTSLLVSRTIAPNETYLCPEVVGHDLNPGGALYAWTDVGEGVHVYITVSGREVTGI